MKRSFLITDGDVYDGTGNPPRRADIRILGDTIQEIGPNLTPAGEEKISASGLIVTPGLIDLHVHVHSGVGIYSIDPFEAGLRTGVTTMLDTGTAGALTYGNLARFIIPQAEEDIFALVNVSMIGAINGHPKIAPYIGDLHDGKFAHAPTAVECVRRHPDRVVGMKVRLTSGIANYEEANEWMGFRAVFESAEETGLPLMIHHIASKIPPETILKALRPGDMLTHLYHPHADHPFNVDGSPREALMDARERGVIFDVGHGVGAFVWRCAEPACRQFGFWPDTISTDIHQFNLHGPVFDLPTTMSKFLYLGMPLEQIVRATTSAPAAAMRLEKRLGLLQAGRQADITILKRESGKFTLTDVEHQQRIADERLVPVSVCKRGKWHPCAAYDTRYESPEIRAARFPFNLMEPGSKV